MAIEAMRAVLWDMDGTLVDSEKLWDIAICELYRSHDRVLSPEVRHRTVGGSSDAVMHIVYADLGLDPDPAEMAKTADWVHEYVGELFETGLPWCAGAQPLLEALAEAQVATALVTNTRRDLADKMLNAIGQHYFSVTVCGDEVPSGKPAPDPYLRAAELLGLDPADCLAVEDSITGAASATGAGCPVLVIPNAVVVPDGPRRAFADSLSGLTVTELRRIHADLAEIPTVGAPDSLP